MEAIGLILARGGSKGIPRKNLADLGGKPLIAWTIEAALESDLHRIVVSTDDDEIAEAAVYYGADVPFMRPPELATDSALSVDAERHAIEALEMADTDILVRLQPTSPFRSAEDINEGLVVAESSICLSAVGVSPVRETPSLVSVWGKVAWDVDERARQDQPPHWRINGALYAASVGHWRCHGWYRQAMGVLIPYPRAWDIDTPFDLEVARALVETGRVG